MLWATAFCIVFTTASVVAGIVTYIIHDKEFQLRNKKDKV